MNLYVDTSSFLKVYLRDEPGRELVESLLGAARTVYISMIGYTEGRSALARARRDARPEAQAYRAAVQAFEQDWNRNTPVQVVEEVVRLAGGFAEKHFLRSLDAIHLSLRSDSQARAGSVGHLHGR